MSTMSKKPISPTAHGALDYSSVGLMLAAPKLLGLKGAARTLSYLFGATYAVVSALTDYKPAIKRVIPFRVHGLIEICSVPALLALPLMLGAWKQAKARNFFLALSATVVTVYSLTDWDADTDTRE